MVSVAIDGPAGAGKSTLARRLAGVFVHNCQLGVNVLFHER